MNNHGRRQFPWIRSFAAVSLASANLHGASLITAVNQMNGDDDRPSAKTTGETFNILNGPQSYTVPAFGEAVYAMTDRIHQHKGASGSLPLPEYLVGREYVMIANNNRDNPSLQIDFSLSQRCWVYLLVDNRIGDGNGANPPNFTSLMTWVPWDEWQPVLNGLNRAGNLEQPDETGVDESADGSINQWYSVYMKLMDAGENVFSTYQQGEGRNMYQIVVDAAVAPTIPAGLAVAVNGDNLVRLSWPSAAGAVSYTVKRSDSAAGPFATIATDVRARTFDDTSVLNGGTYYYVISASNLIGESGDSNQAIGRPNVPVLGLSAVGGANKVTLSWQALAGAKSYRVKRSAVPGGPYSDVGNGISDPSFIDATVDGGRNYYYIVSAALTQGESGASSEASALTIPASPLASVETVSASGLRIGWTRSDPVVDSYTVEESSDGLNFSEIGVVPPTRNFLMAGGLNPSETMRFRVRATNASGDSEYSPVVSGTTAAEGGIYINFANSSFRDGQEGYPIPGFLDDYGDAFEDRGNGFIYGWDVSNTANARQRNSRNSRDRRYDTLNHMQRVARVWEIELTEGKYQVRIVGGDPDNTDSIFQYLVEGLETDTFKPLGGAVRFIDTTVVVDVLDGRLTVENGPNASNNKIAFIEINPFVEPNIKGIQLANGEVTITWTGGGTLMMTDSIQGGVWTPAGTGGRFTATADALQRYFRVVK
ncbi:MAG: hypothetical protein FJ405_03295 [Verrucomicrobia bacterium]|nr:hypothetical protein [Verrucomicrobiota bacterium]